MKYRELSGTAFDIETERYEGQLLVVTKVRIHISEDSLSWNSIDLSGSNLSREVLELKNLSRLGILNLSMNHLTGKIPESIGSLQQINSLMPGQLEWHGIYVQIRFECELFVSTKGNEYLYTGTLYLVNSIDLSNNSLSGNPALCGSPLSNKFKEDKETSESPGVDEKRDNEDRDNVGRLLFYSSIGLGFAVGFWGVCGTLIIKKSWRAAYFQFVDDMNDRFIVVVSLRLASLQRLVKGEGN
ncbi:hypothetical protein JRO89_XSUnG0097300 [Xanthoceras sorbifolium]|uniref:Uncharacterized protein n=1 Tax=Xanthoceras sorbifolium TaxID=99658 RepID=A0ABQ8GYP7_9ROSI|nr:hypothetical protein JRO89_XSUnG0097300 [Xanthoceras sorbifolium]